MASFRTARRRSEEAAAAAEAAEIPAREIRPLTRSRSKSFVREASGILRAVSPQAPPTPPPPPPLAPSQGRSCADGSDNGHLPRLRVCKQVTIVEDENGRIQRPGSPPLHLPPVAPPPPPPLSLTERNRLRARQRAEQSRRILNEPYQVYRIGRNGSLEPLESLPPKFPTGEPTNWPMYEHRKRLSREREAYQQSMQRLSEYTEATLLSQSQAVEAVASVNRAARQHSKATGANAGGYLGVGGGDLSAWARVFIRNELPEGVEPGSFEAMRYVEYIRPDQPRPDRPAGIDHVFGDVRPSANRASHYRE